MRGENCAKEFLDRLQADAERVRGWLKNPEPMPELTAEQQAAYDTATHCWICEDEFTWLDEEIQGKPHKDHCHITGVYRGPAHARCNLNYRIDAEKIEIPCFFHNLKNYDSHLIISAATEKHGKISAIPTNSEKYIAFSIGEKLKKVTFKDTFAFMQASLDSLVNDLKPDDLANTRRYLEMVEVSKHDQEDTESVRSEESAPNTDDEDFIDDDDGDDDDEHSVMTEHMSDRNLVDCAEGENSQLAQIPTVIASESDENEILYAQQLINQHEHLDADFESLDDMVRIAENADQDYRNHPFHTPQLKADEVERVDARLALLKRKGVFPYQYASSFERFHETRLPPQTAFYSKLTGKSVSDDDYAHACKVWETFAAEKQNGEFTFGDYHDLYLLTDVLLLADVMHNFRSLCITNYKLDPWRFFTIPGVSLSAGLRMTRTSVELIQDVDMHLFVEAAMRGGVACVTKRLAETSEEVDENGFRDFLLYLDANNLYGWAMSQPLPTGGYKWLSEEEVEAFSLDAWPTDGDRGCLLEVDLECPDELHDLFIDYPPAPEKKEVTYRMLSDTQRQLLETYMDASESWKSVSKLIPSVESKHKYVLHYRALQLYVRLGLKLTKIYRVLAFDQRPWLEPYIAFNTVQRAAASSEFLKMLFKLMNNAIFGKMMENVRNRRQIEFATTAKRLKKLVARPTYRSKQIISDELTAIENYNTSVYLNKPIIVGQAILDLSKVLMLDFHYSWTKNRYPGPRSELIFTDTDSLCYRIRTVDVYADMLADADMFDWSGYAPSHPAFTGMTPDAVKELRARNKKVIGKMKDECDGHPMTSVACVRAKCYSIKMSNNDVSMKCKGIGKAAVKSQLSHESYRQCILESQRVFVEMHTLRSYAHTIYTLRQVKLALINFDDKRWMRDDGINTYPHGHYKTRR